MRTGGWPMYNYYRDNTGMMPMQNAGMMPAQNAGMMPAQNANIMPVQNTGLMPMSNMDQMPAANVMPMYNTGLMPSANVMPMYNPCNPMAAMPFQSNQFAEMSTEDLENLYPQTYNVIRPVVESTCDNWMSKYGDKCPSEKEYDSMVSDIYKKVEADVEAVIKNSANPEERQFFGGSRRLLRDFIGAALIASLIRRRRRPFFGPFYGGFYGGYPFY